MFPGYKGWWKDISGFLDFASLKANIADGETFRNPVMSKIFTENRSLLSPVEPVRSKQLKLSQQRTRSAMCTFLETSLMLLFYLDTFVVMIDTP